jgi:hypothetical protein
LCLLFLYLAVLRGSGWRSAGRSGSWAATIAPGLPLALLLMAVDYVRYFNTFYRETGTIVFLLSLLVSLAMLDATRHERTAFLLSGASLTLLATAKITNVYWPFLALPFLLLARGGRRRLAAVGAAFLVSVGLELIVFPRAELPPIRDRQAYDSLYIGVLTFSARPVEHLTRLGLEDTVDFVGKNRFAEGPEPWLDEHPRRVTVFTTLDVVLHEPTAFLKELHFAPGRCRTRLPGWVSGPRAIPHRQGVARPNSSGAF